MNQLQTITWISFKNVTLNNKKSDAKYNILNYYIYIKF